ncbi:MAG: YraN family protein [Victivallaceae bacterium]|nr:YraN family protein [Victivallaceae bacterium]
MKRDFHLALGRRGEKDAAKFLAQKRFLILARDWRTRAGELDLVALDGETVVFVEVKARRYRKKASGFRPAQNLSNRQMRRNLHAAKLYRKIFHASTLEARFDLVELLYDRFFRLYGLYHTLDYLPALPAQRSENGSV